MKKLSLYALIFLSACGSPQIKDQAGQVIQPDIILSRIDQMSSRPDWLKESEVFKIDGGVVYSLGSATMPVKDGVNENALFRIAENNAKVGISSSVENKLSVIFQNAEEGTGLDTTQAKFIGAETSNLVTSSLRTGKRYWEKFQTHTESGEKKIMIKVFALVQMPEQDFKKAILDSINKRQGKAGLSAKFSDQVNKHWDKFTETEQQ